MTGNAEAAPQAPQDSNPLRGALVKYCVMALVLFCVLRFVSGRSDWYRAWVYVDLMLGAQIVVGVVLRRVNPALLAERSRLQKGTKAWDKWLAPIVALAGPLAMWITAALEARWTWPPKVGLAYSAAALAVCLLGILLTAWAMVSNPFFAATVRIQDERGQVVVDTGPYRLIRHPGYTGALAFTLATPFALGSWYALIPALLTGAVLALRTALEDRTLQAELPGYADYTRRVRDRLLPAVW
ncbi:methyltransferase family protein [Paludibaculum fermentans]|uniref:Isoprenylcysteine carboxylmethyltransferase family protein n=1 Tax=Paludibaculum fermentans TaxID=1473598 RepID=A0A7S7NY05_PALFE|nr:isoprenylcysteine carboxylmethyltransferase family protein [Paludibaculum fermentans]QOY91841.1 isoprenylcysteine carboxylmethyltransferase family protein [Paludibaculum fermentans]